MTPRDVRRIVGSIPISPELGIHARVIQRLTREQFRRLVAPWEFADVNPFPHIVLFPRFQRALDRLCRRADDDG